MVKLATDPPVSEARATNVKEMPVWDSARFKKTTASAM